MGLLQRIVSSEILVTRVLLVKQSDALTTITGETTIAGEIYTHLSSVTLPHAQILIIYPVIICHCIFKIA